MKRKRLIVLVMSLATVLLLIDLTPINVMPDMQGTALTTRNAVNEAPVVVEEAEVSTQNDSISDSETRHELTNETAPADVNEIAETVTEIADAAKETTETVSEAEKTTKDSLPMFDNKKSFVYLGDESIPVFLDEDDLGLIKSEPDNQTAVMEAEKNGRIIDYHGTEILVTDRDFEILCRIVEAEASIEDKIGKELVANVVLNRVISDRFPNTIEGVVFDGGAFASTKNGRYSSVGVEDSTVEAVLAVLDGADESKGALYFMTKTTAESGRVKWLSTVDFLFRHQHHNFYK